jgi:hypothetical protein
MTATLNKYGGSILEALAKRMLAYFAGTPKMAEA